MRLADLEGLFILLVIALATVGAIIAVATGDTTVLDVTYKAVVPWAK